MVDLPSPGDVKAAVDENALAGNEARLLRAQPDCHIAHISAFGDIRAVAMPDGTLLMGDPIFHTPARWVEIGDGVFRKIDEAVYILPITPFASAAIPRGRPSRNCEEIAVEPAVLITLP